MTFTCPQECIDLAHRLADAARPIALKYFRSASLPVEHKTDNTPVTLADREIEAEMRRIIANARPGDGIFGEEEGHSNIDAEWTWVLDPIDGTKAFSTGRPNFGTLIALHHKQHGIVLGLSDQAVTNDRWFSTQNGAMQWNGKTVHSRGTKTLTDAIFACTDPLRLPAPAFDLITAIRRDVRMTVYGGDCLNYSLIASGFLDITVEARQQLYDIAPFVPMIKNAGGKITQINGQPIGFNNDDLILAASSPELHALVLDMYAKICETGA